MNKVNTKVDMRLDVAGAVAAGWLPQWCADRLVVAEKNRVNSNGELVVNSTRHRTQSQNVDDALEKLQSYINRAAKLPGSQSASGRRRNFKPTWRRATDGAYKTRNRPRKRKRSDGRGRTSRTSTIIETDRRSGKTVENE